MFLRGLDRIVDPTSALVSRSRLANDAIHVAIGEVVDRAAGLLEEGPEEHGEERQDEDDIHALARNTVELDRVQSEIAQRHQTGQEQDQSGRLAGFLQHDGEDFAHGTAFLDARDDGLGDDRERAGLRLSGAKPETNIASTGTASNAPR